MPPPPGMRDRPEGRAASVALRNVLKAMEGTSSKALDEAVKELTESAEKLPALRLGGLKGKPDPFEEEIKEMLNLAPDKMTELAAAEKAAKDVARKALQVATQLAASPMLGDKEELEKCINAAEEANIPDKELNDPRDKLTTLSSFHFKMVEAEKLLRNKAAGKALTLNIKKLEDSITEVKGDAIKTLKQ